jgi:hypothetical protein
MDYVLDILRHSEAVLAKKIKGLKDGKPKWAANEQMTELREAIKALNDYAKHKETVPDGWHNAWPDMPVGH